MISAKFKGESNCYISNIVALSNGGLVVCDSENKCLKKIDATGDMKITYKPDNDAEISGIKNSFQSDKLLVRLDIKNQITWHWMSADGELQNQLFIATGADNVVDISISSSGELFYPSNGSVFIIPDFDKAAIFKRFTMRETYKTKMPRNTVWMRGKLLINFEDEMIIALRRIGELLWETKVPNACEMVESPCGNGVYVACLNAVNHISDEVHLLIIQIVLIKKTLRTFWRGRGTCIAYDRTYIHKNINYNFLILSVILTMILISATILAKFSHSLSNCDPMLDDRTLHF